MVRTEACSVEIFLLVLLLVPGLFNTSSLDVLEGSSVIPNQKEDHAGSWKERFKNTLR